MKAKEERIQIVLPVRIWGMDAQGKPFSLVAETVDIGRHGARLAGVERTLATGDIIGVQHGNSKGRFRVQWVGEAGSAYAGNVGLCSLDAGRYIWGAPLWQLRTPGPSEDKAQGAGVRPRNKRYSCSGGAEIRELANGFSTWGVLTVISSNGCYVETNGPLLPGVQAEMVLTVGETKIHLRAEVRSSHPFVGMGLQFMQLDEANRKILFKLLQTLANQEKGAAEGWQDGNAAPAEPGAAPAEETQSAAVGNISGAIQRIASELRYLEGQIAALALEARIMNELHYALEYARDASGGIQQWIEGHGQQRDPGLMLAELESRRIQTTVSLLRQLIVDIDAASRPFVNEDSAGLQASVTQLYSRMQFLTNRSKVHSG